MTSSILEKHWAEAAPLEYKLGTREFELPKLLEDSYVLKTKDTKSEISITFGRLLISPARARSLSKKAHIFTFVRYPQASSFNVRTIKLNGKSIGLEVPIALYKEFSETKETEAIDDIVDEDVSLDSPDESESISTSLKLTENEKKYVEIALLGLLESESCMRYSKFTGVSEETIFSVLDFYDKKYVISVIDLEQIKKYFPDLLIDGSLSDRVITEFKILMLFHGYTTAYNLDKERFLAHYDWSEGVNNVSCKRISSDLTPHLDEIYDLLDEASQSTSAPVTFFLLYQVIEDLSYIIFKTILSTLTEVFDKQYQKIKFVSNPGDYSSYIRGIQSTFGFDMASTINRIAFLDYFCPNMPKMRYNNLERESFELHQKIEAHMNTHHGNVGLQNQTFFRSIYALRNHVIHSQSKWRMNKILLDDLWKVNRYFLQVLSDLLCNYNASHGLKLVKPLIHPSLPNVFNSRKIDGNQETVLVLFYWLKKHCHLLEVSYAEIKRCYTTLQIPQPRNLAGIVNALRLKKLVGLGPSRGKNAITRRGEKFVREMPSIELS